MEDVFDPKRVVADGYDRMGDEFRVWNAERPPEVRRWFLGEVISRLAEGSRVLEVGCGPGTDAAELSAGRGYVGVDLSSVQLSIARQLVPHATFVVGDFTSMAFRPASFDGIVAFYAFNHVPQDELAWTFERIFAWLRPGGRLMTSLLTIEAEDRVEEWLGVPMFFAGVEPEATEHILRETGFQIELFELREEMDAQYCPSESRWVIARKPEAA
jgi:cyclopropane fatty-acyl-phospholipid synthase-like methyltransferase